MRPEELCPGPISRVHKAQTSRASIAGSDLSDLAGIVLGMDLRDRMTLDLAGARYKFEGAREADMIHLLGYRSPARFWVRVGWLLEQADVEAELPQLVRRLRRQREARVVARVRRGAGIGATRD